MSIETDVLAKELRDGGIDYRDADTAFNEAIAAGRLSNNLRARNYAGNYMYMGTFNGKDAFKHITTRKYLA